ncbi:olfactory receptor 52Z1-like [Rana temporaria]|uniref:olfactory receptor 52Z1-like n=1 Tax=Rana temporaria TaxID=8407 RepID=UPI001AACE84B|nr:olfactory receptor 52Z1-like [Rana temporaria]
MSNSTTFHPDFFLLIGIPGLENSHLLLAIVFSFMYILGVAANSMLIAVISVHESLHQPMYFFLVMLAVGDLVLSSTTVPKTLCIFWFGSHEISFNGCLVQIFFIHFICMTESAILLAMAYDRYIAICYPLSYVTTLNVSFVRTVVSVSVTRSVFIMIPVILLLWRLPYQGNNVIEHTYCEHMAMARLATTSILINIIYGMVIIILTSVIDLFLIGLSYVSIVQAVMRLSTAEARHKTSSTCVSHLCVITLLYVPAFFSFIAHRIPHNSIPPYVHILVANLYVIAPPMLNPIIYGVRTKEIQQKAIKMFTGKFIDYR